MIFRRITWAIGLGVAIAFTASGRAGEPARLTIVPTAHANQQIADGVAAALKSSGVLKGYAVDITARTGVVSLIGTVADASQRDAVIRIAQGVAGVTQVRDDLRLSSEVGLVRVQVPPLPVPLPPPTGGGANIPPPTVEKTRPSNANAMPEPIPAHRIPTPAFTDLNPPRMPPYAWPTYAPYNNYSRVATPEAYPHQAFPFIGPMYPFPKVPLGWRAVKLEWDDGYWYYGQVGNKFNWWKIRYW